MPLSLVLVVTGHISHMFATLWINAVTSNRYSFLLWLLAAISRQSPQFPHSLSCGNRDKVGKCNQNTEGLGGREGKFGANKLQQLLNVTTCRHHQLLFNVRRLSRMLLGKGARLTLLRKVEFTAQEYFNHLYSKLPQGCWGQFIWHLL